MWLAWSMMLSTAVLIWVNTWLERIWVSSRVVRSCWITVCSIHCWWVVWVVRVRTNTNQLLRRRLWWSCRRWVWWRGRRRIASWLRRRSVCCWSSGWSRWANTDYSILYTHSSSYSSLFASPYSGPLLIFCCCWGWSELLGAYCSDNF